MNNKMPFITYNLDKPRTGRLDIRSLMKIRQLDINLLGLAKDYNDTLSSLDFPVDDICNVLYISFQKYEPGITLDKVAELITDYSNVMEAYGKVFDLINNAMPLISGKSVEELEGLKDKTIQEGEDPNLKALD